VGPTYILTTGRSMWSARRQGGRGWDGGAVLPSGGVPETELEAARQAVIEEARTWIGTPFHQNADLKGVGVDCGRILIKVYGACGFRVPIDPPFLSQDWHLHRNEEIYLDIIREFATEIPGPPRLGDVVMFRVARVYGHSGIVLEWPHLLIHAHWLTGVQYVDATQPPLVARPVRFFSPYVTI